MNHEEPTDRICALRRSNCRNCDNRRDDACQFGTAKLIHIDSVDSNVSEAMSRIITVEHCRRIPVHLRGVC